MKEVREKRRQSSSLSHRITPIPHAKGREGRQSEGRLPGVRGGWGAPNRAARKQLETRGRHAGDVSCGFA